MDVVLSALLLSSASAHDLMSWGKASNRKEQHLVSAWITSVLDNLVL